MIENVLSLDEITNKYRVTFDSRDDNTFEVHIGNKIVKFQANDLFHPKMSPTFSFSGIYQK